MRKPSASVMIAALLIAVLLLAACGGGSGTTTPATTSETLIPPDYKTYTSEGLFSISYPPDWLLSTFLMGLYEEETKDLITIIESGSTVEDAVVVFFASADVPIEEGNYNYPNVNIMIFSQEDSWTLDSVVEDLNSAIKDNPDYDYNEFSRTRETIGGRDAIIIDHQMLEPINNQYHHNLWMVTQVGKTIWVIACTAPPEMFSDYEDDFYAIINSFRMLIQ
jgi:hypothetical protein